MKKIIALSVALMVAATFASAQQKAAENWTELKAFHEVMSQTFHPAEKGDLKPIRARAGEIARIETDFERGELGFSTELLRHDLVHRDARPQLRIVSSPLRYLPR